MTSSAPACTVEELQNLCSTLSLQHAEVLRERDEFARQLAAMPRSTAEAEKSLLSIRQARDTLLARNHELLGQLTVAEDRHAELQYQHDDLAKAHAKAVAELAALRQELDALRGQAGTGGKGEGEADRGLVVAMAEMGRQITGLTEERDDALTRAAELDARGTALEAERNVALTRVAELERQRDAARDEANLARRQAEELQADREALREQFRAERATLHAQIAQLHCPQVAPAPAPAEQPSAPPTPPARKDPGIAALLKRLTALEADPENLEELDHLTKLLTAFGARSQLANLHASHRLAHAASEYCGSLRRTPKKIASAIPALSEALGLLDRLGSIKDAAKLPDPSGALVYAVDDDVDNCECITMAFEKVAFLTKYAVRPEAALADFVSARCDLIVLDVDMPGLSGFELQKRIREIEHQSQTPIIFVSGHLSSTDRIAELGTELHRFVPKPYSLTEIALKALTLVVQSRLGPA